jgi:Fe-S-cluster containining protein
LKKKKTKDGINACFSCPIEQECCRRLRFLRLTKSEYLENFVEHQESLVTQSRDETYLISSKEKTPCPNWVANRCAIYTKRPFECRIFPYTLGKVHKKNKSVFISYHDRTHCPHKNQLLMSREKARELILSFAHEAFGGDCIVEIKWESALYKLLTKIKSKLLA